MSKEYPCVHWTDGICKLHSGREITSWCVEAPCADQKPSNADRIRSMTDEELAGMLVHFDGSIDDFGMWETHAGLCFTYEDAVAAEIEWLQKPAEDL